MTSMLRLKRVFATWSSSATCAGIARIGYRIDWLLLLRGLFWILTEYVFNLKRTCGYPGRARWAKTQESRNAKNRSAASCARRFRSARASATSVR